MSLKRREDKQGYYWDKQLYENTKSWIYEALLLILLCAFFVAGAIYGLEANKVEPELEWIEYVVKPGDTLWGIAATNVQSQAIDKTVWQIRERNGIDPVIWPGQVLLVPREPERKEQVVI